MKIINTIKNIRLIIIEELIKIRYLNIKEYKTSILQYKKEKKSDFSFLFTFIHFERQTRFLSYFYSGKKPSFSTNSAKTSSIDWFALTVISLFRLFSF